MRFYVLLSWQHHNQMFFYLQSLVFLLCVPGLHYNLISDQCSSVIRSALSEMCSFHQYVVLASDQWNIKHSWAYKCDRQLCWLISHFVLTCCSQPILSYRLGTYWWGPAFSLAVGLTFRLNQFLMIGKWRLKFKLKNVTFSVTIFKRKIFSLCKVLQLVDRWNMTHDTSVLLLTV